MYGGLEPDEATGLVDEERHDVPAWVRVTVKWAGTVMKSNALCALVTAVLGAIFAYNAWAMTQAVDAAGLAESGECSVRRCAS